jgi:hypothetical protein
MDREEEYLRNVPRRRRNEARLIERANWLRLADGWFGLVESIRRSTIRNPCMLEAACGYFSFFIRGVTAPSTPQLAATLSLPRCCLIEGAR